MTLRYRYPIAVAIVLLAAVVGWQLRPAVDITERWSAHDPASTLTIDHSAWDELLSRYVTQRRGVNRFNYETFGASDRAILKAYLAALSTTPISDYNRQAQQAFWINLYNLLTVKVILEHYPVKSIYDISPDLLPPGPWSQTLVEIEGDALSLDDIEHRILRPIWSDPRIHYAVNCAAMGCPNLQPKAFTAENTEAMLDAAAREFINHRRAVNVSYGLLRVSSLYDWYQEDFGGSEAGVFAHLRKYGNERVQGYLQDRSKVDNYHYDWTINSPKSFEHGPGRVGRRGS